MPVLNEKTYLRPAVESIRNQQGVLVDEILLVLGNSTDGTDDIAAALEAEDPRVRLLRNPRDGISRSLNIGIREARNDVVVRVDAHAMLPSDYAEIMVRSLEAHGAVNAGGRMRAEGESPLQEAVAWAYNSPAGLGGAVYHVGGEPGPAESAYLGVFRRDAVLAIAGFDESLSRGEDWEMNKRLISAGGLVWFEPSVEVTYRPRASLRAVARQFHASGRWRGELIRRDPRGGSVRYLVPMSLVIALALSVVALIGAALTDGSVSQVLLALGLVTPAVYGAFVLGSAVSARNIGLSAASRLLVVLPLMHVCWGWGSLLGLLLPAKGDNAFVGR